MSKGIRLKIFFVHFWGVD